MAVYFVAVVTNPSAVLAKAKELYPDAVFRLTDDKFFVNTDQTSLDLSNKIGVRDGTIGTGIVLRVTTYNGRVTSTLWEWLGARMEK